MDTSLIVALVGVGGTLLGSIIGLTSGIIQEKIRLNAERKNHIIKSLFDKEFVLYQSLNEKFVNLLSASRPLSSAIKSGLQKSVLEESDRSYFRKEASKYLDAYEIAELELVKCSPYIKKEIYNKYCTLLDLSYEIVETTSNVSSYFSSRKEEKEAFDKDKNADSIIHSVDEYFKNGRNLWKEILGDIKEHLKSLEDNKNV